MKLRSYQYTLLSLIFLFSSASKGFSTAVTGDDYIWVSGNSTASISPVSGEAFLFFCGEKGALRFADSYYSSYYSTNLYVPSFGVNSIAIGPAAVSASGNYSIAIGGITNAAGNNSFASGAFSNANGNYSFTFGYQVATMADYTLAFGYGSQAHGIHSLAFGKSAKANDDYSTSIGYFTETYVDHQFVIGLNNSTDVMYFWDWDEDGNIDAAPAYALFTIGNGGVTYGDAPEATPSYSNAFSVFEDGTVWAAGNLEVEGELHASVPPKGGIGMGNFNSN